MTDLNDYFYTDGVHDVLAQYINALVSGNLRGELTNVEALAADKVLTDGDFPIQFLDPDGTDRLVTTPEADGGNHLFFIAHQGSANTITVKNSDETITLGVLDMGEVMLAVSGGTADYAAIKTTPATNLIGYIKFDAATELTISSDAITVTQTAHKLQPESGTTDNLSTIDAGSIPFGVLYVSDFGTDTITIKHNVGNILCLSGSDISLSNGAIAWFSDGTKVFVIGDGAGGAGTAYDMLSMLINSEVPITGANTANWGKQHVVSGSTNYTVAIAACSGNAGKFLSLRITNTGITTVDPNGSEAIDGVSSRIYFQDSFVILYTDGSNVFTVYQKTASRGVIIPIQSFNKNSATIKAINTSQYWNLIEYQSSAANGDWLEDCIFLQKGTYTCECLGYTQGVNGILDWTLDGVSQTTGQDWYSASPVNDVSKTFTLTVPYTGYHKLKGTVNGKNASSSNYYWVLTYINIYPSAY